jgi:hypothetical protein
MNNHWPLNPARKAAAKPRSIISVLEELQKTSDTIRRQLRIHARNEIISQYEIYATSDEKLIVTADGFGGATVLWVEGNYPIDYNVKNCRKFPQEKFACNFADEFDQGLVEWPDWPGN